MSTEFKLSYTGQEIDERLTRVEKTVCFTEQTLTKEQQTQARANIGAVAVADVVSVALARGTVAQAKYVSPISHELKVKLSSDTITDFSSTTVAVYGKNLFDKTTATIGVGLATSTGGVYETADHLTSDYIPITPNTRLVINWSGGKWSNILDSGTLRSGEEYTPTVEHNSSPIVGVRFTFLKTDGSNVTTDEITSVRLYKKVRDQYTISTELDGVIISNDSTTVAGNSSYSATLTANTDIVATVVMGGVDVTAFVYTDGIINIPAVTGDVVITAYSYDNWSLIKTITPDQLHIGGLTPNDELSNGLYMSSDTYRLCYPHWDIEAIGEETYKVVCDAKTDMKVGMQFFNQWQLSSFVNNKTSNWNNLKDTGLMNNGAEYTPPTTTNNGGNVVGLRMYFKRTDGAQVDGTEITEARVYKKVVK